MIAWWWLIVAYLAGFAACFLLVVVYSAGRADREREEALRREETVKLATEGRDN